MDIDVTTGHSSETRRLAGMKKAPSIARGIFLSADDVRRAAQGMLMTVGVREAGLSIVFLDGRAMRRLNRESLGHDYVTDVITFDLRETLDTRHSALVEKRRKLGRSSIFDGEIYICPAEAKRNARLYGEPVEREVLRYVAHGILHLLGQDDRTEAERECMRELENKLLETLGTDT